MKSTGAVPVAFPAGATTACAIVSFGGCFASVVDQSRPWLTMLGVLCAMCLSACAVVQWYYYFTAYIDYRLQARANESVASETLCHKIAS